MPDFKSRDPARIGIRPEAFNAGNALSFSNQPSLGSFLEAVAGDEPMTFVLGAGVSVDSGFPSWDGLIKSLAAGIDDRTTRKLAERDLDGPMRHAESIFRMISKNNPDTDADVIRTALYGRMAKTEPGPIARILAELWERRSPKITLLTTNFDDVLEEALERQLGGRLSNVAYSLYAPGEPDAETPEHDPDYGGIGSWRSALTLKPEEPTVMHLHGMVRRRMNPLRPVILSESHFLWHGPKVRDVVREQLENSTVVFIGVSLNDPNLVGPLWDVSRKYKGENRAHPCFVLHVPSAVSGAKTIDEARTYVLNKYEYMEDALGVTPVFFKSYSQLYQAFIEANLAVQNSDYMERSYMHGYGARLSRRLATAWENVGSPNAQFEDSSLELRQVVSDQLAELIDVGTELGDLLRQPGLRVLRRQDNLRRTYEDFGNDDEQFAVFLWLRVLPPPGEMEAAPYALAMAATSAYVHREDWTFDRRALIEPDSPLPAAQAVYSGLLTRANLPPTGRFTTWKGCWAIPLRLSNRRTSDESDVVTVGAVTLNTTHHAIPAQVGQTSLSILASLGEDPALSERIRSLLESGAADLLGKLPNAS